MSAAAPATDIRVGASTSLRTLGTNMKTRWGWENSANVRGRPIAIAYRDGGHITGTPGLDPKLLAFDMLIWGRDRSTGYVTTDPWEHLDDNVQWLKGLLGAGQGVDLRFYRADGSIHQAYDARWLDAAEFNPATSEGGAPILRARIPMWVPEGTLRDITGGTTGEQDATNTNLTGSGTANITVGGNVRTAPVITIAADSAVDDLVISFPDGATLSYSATIPTSSTLILNCADRVVTLDGVYADAALESTGRRAYWGYLEGGAVNGLGYSVSGGQFDLTVDWYDRWR